VSYIPKEGPQDRYVAGVAAADAITRSMYATSPYTTPHQVLAAGPASSSVNPLEPPPVPTHQTVSYSPPGSYKWGGVLFPPEQARCVEGRRGSAPRTSADVAPPPPGLRHGRGPPPSGWYEVNQLTIGNVTFGPFYKGACSFVGDQARASSGLQT